MYLNNFLSQNQNNRWGFFCILLYGLLVGFQGFDLCDEGSVVILGGLTFVNFPLCIHLC